MSDVSPGLLPVYLLGAVEFDAAERLQRDLAARLAYQRDGALVLCEHPPLVTVGRQGRAADLLAGQEELAARRWPVRWVHRGGGIILHLPGQLAVYPVLPLDFLGLSVRAYLHTLRQVLVAVLDDFSVTARSRADDADVWVGERRIARVGIAVRNGISTFGAVLNVDPDLTVTRQVLPGEAFTALAVERRGALRPSLVRQQLVETFRDRLGFAEADVLFYAPTQPGHHRLSPA
ncbi:MAG: lipoyl(octanoyl) transferase LipB [Gemmataceae bacterium]